MNLFCLILLYQTDVNLNISNFINDVASGFLSIKRNLNLSSSELANNFLNDQNSNCNMKIHFVTKVGLTPGSDHVTRIKPW